MTRRYERYVALGDSSAEGLDDPDGQGGFRGWADRLAEHLARAQGAVAYANLAVRGRRTREILQQQLEPALDLRPGLASLLAGTNDLVRLRCDVQAVAADVEHMQRALARAGATVLTFTLPDFAAVLPLARLVARRARALNAALRRASGRSGAVLVDLARHPVTSDPRLWSVDRLHANALGHARMAAALACALRLPGSDESWARPLPPLAPPARAERWAAEWAWSRRYFWPWLWRRLRGRSSGDGRGPKRPELLPLVCDGASATPGG